MCAGPLAVGVLLASFMATSRMLPLAKLSALDLSGSVLMVPVGCDCDGPGEGRRCEVFGKPEISRRGSNGLLAM